MISSATVLRSQGDECLNDSILERVARGDSVAVEECLDRYGPLVWSLARRHAPNPEHAEDAVQEIFIDIWKSAGRYDAKKASEAAFIAMIARRRLIDRVRASSRRPPAHSLTEEFHVPDPKQAHLEQTAEASLAMRALKQIDSKERDVILLSVYHGMSHGQIADKTGLPLGTVKTYIRRGLGKVKELLDAPQLGKVTS